VDVLAAFLALLLKDFKLLSRRPHEVLSLSIATAVIGLAVAYIVSSPVGLAASNTAVALTLAAGQLVSLFISAIAAGFLAVLREAEKGTLDGIRSTPVPPEAVYLAKLVYTFTLTLIIALSYTLTAGLLATYSKLFTGQYIAAVLVASLYFAAASALTSFMIVYSEARSLLAMVVLAGLLTPFVQNAGRTLAEAAIAPTPSGQLAQLAAVAASFAAIATLLSRPLAEI
jgi:ABC-type transport system involved in cytochrome c biogenesis permease component